MNREADAQVARLGERLRSNPAVHGAAGLDRAKRLSPESHTAGSGTGD